MSEAVKALMEERLAEVLACVPADRFVTGHQVWEKLGRWSYQTVRSAYLIELVKRGLVERKDAAPGTAAPTKFRRISP